MEKIMIVEDDEKMRTELSIILQKYGYECILVDDFTDVAGHVKQEMPDLVLLI